ncbi:MAG: phage/plasmid primase, P4 family [Chloroflexi bacterium]|nr:phage/plasmid primase, P4 family [Chloroflexota bacterium]
MNGSDDKIAYLRRAFGYALRSETGEECIFCFFGSGRNGKSKALGAFEYVLGDYAKATRSDTFTEQGKGNNASSAAPDLADLAGVRFAPTTETGENSRIAESLLKWATGGDMIKARHLFSNLFLFKPQFKLFLASNHKPRITGTDEGIWSRIRTVPFTVTIPAEERDRNLSDKLEAEADGILRWAVEGCLEWQIHGLGEPDEVREATANYRAEMDVPGGFFSDCCVVHD